MFVARSCCSKSFALVAAAWVRFRAAQDRPRAVGRLCPSSFALPAHASLRLDVAPIPFPIASRDYECALVLQAPYSLPLAPAAAWQARGVKISLPI